MAKFQRKFGKTKGDGQPFVVDLYANLKVGVHVMAPEPDGTRKRRKVIKIGDGYDVGGELVVRGYLHDGFNTTAMLKSEHWTPKQIALLGEPDLLRPNPVIRSGAPVRLWSDQTVAKVQRTKAFQSMLRPKDKVIAAKASARKAVATKTAKTRALLDKLPVKVRKLDNDALLKNSIAHFNDFADYRDDCRGEVHYASTQSDQNFLERIQVNYARHELSNYDRNHEELNGLVGHAKARELMAERVFAQIAKMYPHLEKETLRQVDRRARMQDMANWH